MVITHQRMVERARRVVCWAGWLMVVGISHGADWNADSTPTEAELNALIASASHGDNINIPACDVTWTANTEVLVNKALWIVGAGIGQTIIRDGRSSNQPLFEFEMSSAQDSVRGGSAAYRLTGIEIRNANSGSYNAGVLNIGGTTTKFRMDHNQFGTTTQALSGNYVVLRDWVVGVADHNNLYSKGEQIFRIFHDTWGGGSNDYGDGSWTNPVNWGEESESFFIESNNIQGVEGDEPPITDTFAGARFTGRKNTIINAHFSSHGTGDGSGTKRGLRSFEIYWNEFIYSPPSSHNTFMSRGGTGFYALNTHVGVSKYYVPRYYRGEGQRACGPFFTVPQDYDTIDLTDTYGTPGDGKFFEGTATTGSGNNLIVVAGSPWTPGEWAGQGYFARVPVAASNANGVYSHIIGNTSNTLTLEPDVQASNCPHIVASGEAFWIGRLILGLDSTGAGTTSAMSRSGSTPVPTNLGQDFDPVRVFGNTFDGATPSIGGNGIIRVDEHFVVEVGGFDGSTGMGVGALGSRPSSCTLDNTYYFVPDTLPMTNVIGATGTLYTWSGGAWDSGIAFPETTTHSLIEAESPADTDPPTPDPMTFAVAPAAVGPSTITMTATTASDVTGPVEYQVRRDGVTETSWQSSTSFTVSGLTPATEYDFEVRARDSASTPNVTAYSSVSSATTDAAAAAPAANVTNDATAGSVTVGP